jgi:hypothetical protein
MEDDYNFLKHHPPTKNFFEEDIEMNFFNSYNIEDENESINKIFPFKIDEKYTDVIFPSMRLTEDIPHEEENNNNKLNNNINNISFECNKNNINFIDNNNNNINNNCIENNNNINSFISLSSNQSTDEFLLNKISNIFSNYNHFLENYPYKNINHNNLNLNFPLIENTLPGSIIILMKKNNKPLSIEYIYNNLINKFSNFRKANGAKYSNDFCKVLKSTLNSSGIFIKINDLYYYKEEESLNFIIKTIERELKKTNTSKNKKNSKEKNFNLIGYKISKLNTILDNMILRYKGVENNINFKEKFNYNDDIILLEKISKEDRLLGIILCIKYFKELIEKYMKLKKKKLKNFEKKICEICQKIDEIEKNFNDRLIKINDFQKNEEIFKNNKFLMDCIKHK